jgi:hypothetical protein
MHTIKITKWKDHLVHPYTVPSVLFLAALLIRSYRLSNNLLWLDELYGYQLGQLGVGAIIRNSGFVPHPPLYYLLQYVTSGFGMFHSAWAWRWFSVLSGAASVPLLYLLAKNATTAFSAFLASLLFLISPAQIFFSQESRPYALLVCLATLATLLVLKIQAQPDRHRWWIGFTGSSLVGIWCSYAFIMIVGVQLLYLAIILRHWRSLLVYAGAIVLGCLPFIGVSIATLHETQSIFVASAPVTPWLLAQGLLVADYARYGMFWAHTWVPIALVPLALIGLWRTIRLWDEHASVYHAMQVVLPLAAFFTIAVWLLHVSLPAFEWKQFLILSPSLFVLFAFGVDQLQALRPRWAGSTIALAISVLVICASILGLQRYWSTQKSPEGLAALFVRDHMQADDAVVSLHYSLDAAISFYVPNTTPYTNPRPSGSGLLFARSALIVPVGQEQLPPPASAAMIHQHSRIWLLFLATKPETVPGELVDSCTQAEQHDFPPFRVLLERDCR